MAICAMNQKQSTNQVSNGPKARRNSQPSHPGAEPPYQATRFLPHLTFVNTHETHYQNHHERWSTVNLFDQWKICHSVVLSTRQNQYDSLWKINKVSELKLKHNITFSYLVQRPAPLPANQWTKIWDTNQAKDLRRKSGKRPETK